MFRQVDRSGPYSHGGLGIGLFIVKRLVEMHGGTIDARSNGPGTGTEFEVRLPAIAAPAATVDAESSADDGASQPRRRVLVVDDNQDAAEALATILSMSGHDTELAHDGMGAIAAAASFRPEVVFLDIGMPSIDGHETARRIREQPWGKDMVLVALTGWGQAEDRRKSREAGFNHHLVKPADPTLVAELLSKLPLVSCELVAGPAPGRQVRLRLEHRLQFARTHRPPTPASRPARRTWAARSPAARPSECRAPGGPLRACGAPTPAARGRSRARSPSPRRPAPTTADSSRYPCKRVSRGKRILGQQRIEDRGAQAFPGHRRTQ